MNWKVLRVVALIGVVGAGLATLLLVGRPIGHKQIVKAYFTNAISLRSGAPVRLAGVDIGSVKSVRARPEAKEAPVEVIMVLTPGYDLTIPNDSTASLATAGVLGETYVSIDASRASGPPLEANGVLKTIPTVELSTQDMLKKVDEIIAKKCDCDSKSGDTDSTAAKKLSKNRH